MNRSILDHALISERYFFPRQVEFEDPYWVDNKDVKLSCYYFQKNPDFKTVVLFHGNGEIVLDYVELYVPIFAEMEFNCFLAEYRGYSMSYGTPSLVSMLEDVACIINAINQPPENLILFGRSIGSIYAIHGASIFPNISGLIVESGIANILDRILFRVQPEELGVSKRLIENEVKVHFNHEKKLSNYKGPSLFLHAADDSLLHVSHGEQLYEWAQEPKKLKIFEVGDHNGIFYMNKVEYINELKLFLSKL